jgi:hypothetical protein
MKLLKNEIRKIILEQVDELFAEEEDNTRLSRDSLDDQIDSFIIKFENDSLKAEDQEDEVLKSLKEMSLRILMNEQDAPPDAPEFDEEEEDSPAEEPEEDAGDDEPIDSTAVDISEPAEVPMLPLDIDAFIKRIARLALNADTLLDVKTVIVNRALNFLKDNYNDAHAAEAMEILDSQFDFNLGGEKEPPEAPFAAGAWAGGTGGLGGGGGGA